MTSAPLHPVSRTVDLDHAQLLVLEDHAHARVQVLFGGMWLTEPGSLEDRFGAAGDASTLRSRGRAVVEAIGHTRLRIDRPPRRASALGRVLAWLHQARDRTLAHRAIAASGALVLSLGLAEGIGRGLHDHAAAARGATPGVAASPAPGSTEGATASATRGAAPAAARRIG